MKKFLRVVGYFVAIFFILNILIQTIKETDTEERCPDGFDVLNTGNDRLHTRGWNSIDQSRSFCGAYRSKGATSDRLAKKRLTMNLRGDSYLEFWSHVYASLVTDSKSDIGFLVDSLAAIGDRDKLSRLELAELIVSFVQDIPYSFVVPEDCKEIQTDGKPCAGNIPLGILSPYEFIHSLYGDCDTRAVLIYTILEELDFDPMIVVSNEYAHAMLALKAPATGDYLLHQGEKYYFWETTAKGWPLGMLPPNTGNVNYWKSVLAHEL